MNIRQARAEDAAMIAEAVVTAIGEEAVANFCKGGGSRADVARVFEQLARRDDTQYSYRNSLIATDDAGHAVGVAVAYDGAQLQPMREHFFAAARRELGLDLSDVGDECEPDEYYLDTLAVLPAHRGMGYATALIKASADRAARCGKPLGLLVEKENHRAHRLYARCGFRPVGERPFAYILMDHLQLAPEPRP